MSLYHGGLSIVDGLVFCMDTMNPKCYPGSGNIVYDLSGNNNNGTITGATFNSEKKYFSFDGNDYISFSNIKAINNNCVSLGCWSYFNSMSAWTGIITKGIDTGSYGIQLDGSGNHKLQFTANWSPGQYVKGNSVLTISNWYYLFATYNNKIINLYINGILDFTTTVAWNLIENEENLIIGCDFPGGDEYINGKIQDVRIYNRALTLDEISFNYENSKRKYE